MAEIDDRAFDFMQKGDPDKYITGGAVEHSKYEMDMSPEEQENFLRQNTQLFERLYNVDPLADKEKLPFANWLKVLNPEYIKILSEDYDHPKTNTPREPKVILSKDIMKQAEKHWGGIEGIKKIKNLALGFDE